MTLRRTALSLFLLVLCLLTLVPSGFGQTEAATLSGLITDPQGKVVPGVDVEVTNVDTNVSVHQATNSSGLYVVVGLKPGRYRASVTKVGFRRIDLTDLVLNVQDVLSRNFQLQLGPVLASITVVADSANVNTTDASVSTVIDRQLAQSLPLNGRSFNTLLQLTPGVVIAPQTSSEPQGQFSIAGQRTDANNFTVDGVSANFGVGSDVRVGQSGTGSAQAFSALGGTSSLVSVDALQEFRVETSSFAPEFGRAPGGQIILTTRSGTNDFHGAAFDYFRNTVMDANDWFNNALGKPRSPEHHNDFGGVLGGPVWRDKTFFFFSYEGARLIVPQGQPIAVPSNFARSQAQTNAPTLLPFLNAYPKPDPNSTISPDGYTAAFTLVSSNTASLDATSIRIDHSFGDRFSIFGRYNYAPSSILARQGVNLSPIVVNTQTATFGLNMGLSTHLWNTVRANYSAQDSHSTTYLDSFGGAVPLDPTLLLGSLSAANNTANFQPLDASPFSFGSNSSNRTRQLNFVDDLSLFVGVHQLKIGGDYRVIFLNVDPFQHEAFYQLGIVKDFITSGTAVLTPVTKLRSRFRSQAFSLYAQDTWRMNPRLTLTYGLRWELNPAPSALGSTQLASWTNVNNPANIALAPLGTPLWSTTYANFGPRIGVAYKLNDSGNFVIRAGGGIFYDLGVGASGDTAADFPNQVLGNPTTISLPSGDITSLFLTPSLLPPYSFADGFSPNLKLPRSYQWNVALEKSLGSGNVISATYVGQAGRNLLRTEALSQPNANFASNLNLRVNSARSNYNALQLQYRRPLASRVQALLNYTWSHSLDSASDDVTAGLSNTVISAANDYASSSFDVRQTFSGAVTYAFPAAAKSGPLNLLTRDWSADTIIVARTGFPFNALNALVSPDVGGTVTLRPDVVPGQPFWVSAPSAPGGKILNTNAFTIPTTVRQGTEGRNDIPGFGLTQIDLSLGRNIHFTERLNLQFRADAFNLFNHPNFVNPAAQIGFGPSPLQAGSMLNQGLAGLNSLFQEGGPRSLQLSLKFIF